MKWWLVLRSEVCKLGGLTSSLPTGVHLHPGFSSSAQGLPQISLQELVGAH